MISASFFDAMMAKYTLKPSRKLNLNAYNKINNVHENSRMIVYVDCVFGICCDKSKQFRLKYIKPIKIVSKNHLYVIGNY